MIYMRVHRRLLRAATCGVVGLMVLFLMVVPGSSPALAAPTVETTTEAAPPDTDVGTPVDDTDAGNSVDDTDARTPADDTDTEGPEAAPDIKAPPSNVDTDKSAVRDREALLTGKHSTGPKRDAGSRAVAGCTSTDFSAEPPIFSVVALNRLFGRVRQTDDQVLKCQG
jgi:hypothetical protein